MKRLAAALLTLATTVALGAVAVPASAATAGYVQVTVTQADTTPAEQTCVSLLHTVTGNIYDVDCDAADGIHINSSDNLIPAGTYKMFAGWDLSVYDHQWQWYAGPTSSTALYIDAATITVPAGGLDLTWRLSEGLIGFSDVGTTHPFFREITDLAALGTIGGYTDGTFKSTNPVSRQAMAAFLARTIFDSPDAYAGVPSYGFTDVPLSHPFADEINVLAYITIIGGYDDGTFRPTNPVSRQAAAAFFARIAGTDFDDFVPPVEQTFSDVGPSHPFYAHIEYAYLVGLVNGYDDGTYRSTNAVSRQAVAAMLYRFVNSELCCTGITSLDTTSEFATPARSR